MSARLTGTPFERTMARVVLDGDCLIWTGATDEHGYGYVSGGRRGLMLQTHRVTYVELRGPIPVGLELDHLCERPPCIAPWHLEPVTHGENNARRYNRTDACKKCGGPLSPPPPGTTVRGRRCMPCKAAHQREYMAGVKVVA